MKLPLSLLKSFIRLDIPLAQIAETLTLLGIEVDAIENEHPPFARVVVGEVLSVKRHPNAEKLQIAEVSDGHQTHHVVCGAPNCRAGMKTAFAPVGAILTDSKGAQIRIESAKLRGVDSFGMLCSESELRLSASHDGIMELPSDWKGGQDLLPLLWDPVLELSLTPKGHCARTLRLAQSAAPPPKIPSRSRNAARPSDPCIGPRAQTLPPLHGTIDRRSQNRPLPFLASTSP